MAAESPRTFSATLRAFRSARRIHLVELAKLSQVTARSLSRWERQRVRPRDAEVRKLIAAVAQLDRPSALEMASVLGITPPADLTPPPPVAAPPVEAPVAPVAPPVPAELAIDPMEAAVFRAAEALGMSPTPLRPVLARFLGHVAALGLGPAEAQLRLG